MERRPTAPPWRREAAAVLVVGVGVVLQLAVLLIVLASRLVAPSWAVGLGAAVWLASLVPFSRALRTRPVGTPLVALAVLAAWIVFVSVGDVALGWTA